MSESSGSAATRRAGRVVIDGSLARSSAFTGILHVPLDAPVPARGDTRPTEFASPAAAPRAGRPGPRGAPARSWRASAMAASSTAAPPRPSRVVRAGARRAASRRWPRGQPARCRCRAPTRPAEPAGLAHHHADDQAAPARPERGPDAELAPPPLDPVGHHAVDADHRDERRPSTPKKPVSIASSRWPTRPSRIAPPKSNDLRRPSAGALPSRRALTARITSPAGSVGADHHRRPRAHVG